MSELKREAAESKSKFTNMASEKLDLQKQL